MNRQIYYTDPVTLSRANELTPSTPWPKNDNVH